jgi:hypothetical protein
VHNNQEVGKQTFVVQANVRLLFAKSCQVKADKRVTYVRVSMMMMMMMMMMTISCRDAHQGGADRFREIARCPSEAGIVRGATF